MDPGILIVILIFFFALLSFAFGAYCHFCGESGSGGRYYGSNQNIAVAAAVFTKRAAGADPTANNCDCRREFKGRCESCEGDTFVDDGELGSPRDFANYGGDQGFGFPAAGRGGGGGGPEDPIRGLLGNGSAPTSALDQPDRISSYVGGGGQY